MSFLDYIDEIIVRNPDVMHSYKDYGLTGKLIKVRARKGSANYYLWGDEQVPVKINAEYPNFLSGTVLPHMNHESGRVSQPYPITIHKHDIILLDVIPEYEGRPDFERNDYGYGQIRTLRDLRQAVPETCGVKAPKRWQLTVDKNPVITCCKNGITVEVFENGFIAATCGYCDTVFRIEELRGHAEHLEEVVDKKTGLIIQEAAVHHYKAEYFMDLCWEIRTLIEADNRLGIRAFGTLGDRVEKLKNCYGC